MKGGDDERRERVRKGETWGAGMGMLREPDDCRSL